MININLSLTDREAARFLQFITDVVSEKEPHDDERRPANAEDLAEIAEILANIVTDIPVNEISDEAFTDMPEYPSII